MRMWLIAILVGAVWPAGLAPAKAQTVSREAAQASIDSQAAGDQFTLEPGETAFLAVHARSGLVCLLDGSDRTWPEVVASPSLPRGDDVACHDVQSDTVKITTYATLLPGIDAALILQGVQSSIEKLYVAKPYTGLAADMSTDAPALPQTLRVRYEAIPPQEFQFPGIEPGEPVYTAVSIAKIGDWVFKQRLTAPLADALKADIAGQINWLYTLTTATQRKADSAPQ